MPKRVRSEQEKASHRAWLAANAERVRETKRAWRKANAERVRAQKRARYAARIEEERRRDRERYAANPEKKRAAARAWRTANPDKERSNSIAWYRANREALRAKAQRDEGRSKKSAYARRHYASNAERLRSKAKVRYRANPRRAIASSRAWRARNKQKVREYSAQYAHRRRAWLAGTFSDGVAPEEWKALVASFGGTCAYCGDIAGTTMDHIVPISKGGRHEIGNVLPACTRCNCSKQDKDLDDWLAEMEVDDPRRQSAGPVHAEGSGKAA